MLTFTNEPVPVPPFPIAPANVPLLSVNAVPSNVTNPVDAPSSVNNVTALAVSAKVPSTVTTAFTGTNAPDATLNVAPFATLNAVDAKLPLPVNANVPAFTLVVPVNVFEPLKLNTPVLTFTNEPVPVPPFVIAPPNVPSLSVNVVPPSVTNPPDAPFNVKNSTPAADNANVPLAVTTAPAGNTPPGTTLNVAPEATPTTSELNPPLNTNVPAFTLVEPV